MKSVDIYENIRAIAQKIAISSYVSIDSALSLALISRLSNVDVDAKREFSDIWDCLPADLHMADGGRYRFRRFSSLFVDLEHNHSLRFTKKPERAFYQSTTYNALNGGVERFFEPLSDQALENSVMQAILRLFATIVMQLSSSRAWDIELHPIRTVSEPGKNAKPTPEGVHRDGVDYFFVILLRRRNIVGAVSAIYDDSKREIFRHTMCDPFEFIGVDDTETFHAVTPFYLENEGELGIRDVLVVNFRDIKQRDRRLT